VLNIGRNVSFAVIEAVVNAALIFLTYKIVAVSIGLEKVGLWASVYAWVSLVRLGDVGMAGSVIRFVSALDMQAESKKVRNYVETGLLLNIALFVLLALVAFWPLWFYVPQAIAAAPVDEIRSLLPLMLISFVLFNISTVVGGTISSLHLGYVRSVVSISSCIVQLAGVATLVPAFGLRGMAFAQIAQYAFFCSVGWVLIRMKLGLRNWLPCTFDIAAFRDMIHFSVRGQVESLSATLFEPISKIVVGWNSPLGLQGVYEMAFKTVLQTRGLVISACTATLPALVSMFTKRDPEGLSFFRQMKKRTTLLMIATMSGVALASPLICWIWLGHFEYSFVLAVSLLSLGYAMNGATAPAYLVGRALGVLRFNILANLITVLFFLISGSIASMHFGFLGIVVCAALALIIGSTYQEKKNIQLLHEYYAMQQAALRVF
jgi:O-antigen/teichoic acid export membrane protein